MKRAFVYGMSVEGENFTDRKEETKRLKMDFENGINVILISPRRTLAAHPLHALSCISFLCYRQKNGANGHDVVRAEKYPSQHPHCQRVAKGQLLRCKRPAITE